MTFKKLDTYGKNTGQAYLITVIIGDCFCPNCSTIIEMSPPKAGDWFFGQCTKCGYYFIGKIKLHSNGLTGIWKEN